MNNIQKILIMVGCGSVVMFLVSITFLHWSWENPFHVFAYNRINYLGLISLFNVVVCSVGFILFKDG